MAGKLTARQRIFVDSFLGVSRGNATDAARRAGCKGNTARVTSVRWLAKASVQRAIAERNQKRESRGIATAERIDSFLTEVMDDTIQDMKHRLSAAKELDKVQGRHSINVKLSGNVTIAERLGALRKRALERAAARSSSSSKSKGARA